MPISTEFDLLRFRIFLSKILCLPSKKVLMESLFLAVRLRTAKVKNGGSREKTLGDGICAKRKFFTLCSLQVFSELP